MNLSLFRRAGAPVCPRSSAHTRLFRPRFTTSKSATLLLLLSGTALVYAQDASPAAVKTKPALQIHVMLPSTLPGGSSELSSKLRQRALAQPNLTPVNTGPGIVYVCDPSIDATVAGTCNYLNTTVAGWYNGTFTNANASLYITYGDTSLGSSTFYGNSVGYDQYVAAVTANTNMSAIQTSALAAIGTYDGSYSGGSMGITGALGTTLGLGTFTGITPPPAFAACTLGTDGCYNVIITITNHPETPLYYDNLGGTEPSDAYDFYGTTAHETDEALGTSSCLGGDPLSDGCGTGVPSVVDLFRYSSAGNLVLASTLDTTPGQYFSYDGGTTNPGKGQGGQPLFYNTEANGADYADYASLDPCQSNIAVQDAFGCPGFDKGLSILNDGGSEINILNAVGYNVPATASAPAVKLSKTGIAFGNQTVGTTSSPMQVTLTNTGNATLDITSITVTGTNSSSFVFPNTCGTTLTAGSQCTLSGNFKPSTKGTLTAAITFTDNASGSPQSVSLSGTGTIASTKPPAVSFSENVVRFGTEKIGTATLWKQQTLTNIGGSTLTFSGITLTGHDVSSFAFKSDCGNHLAVGAHCTIHENFKPRKSGALTAAVTFADNTSHTPQKIYLTGTGKK